MAPTQPQVLVESREVVYGDVGPMGRALAR